MTSLRGYVVLDVETTIVEHLGRKASAFTSDNWIVATGWSVDSGPTQGEYYGRNFSGSKGFLRKLLAEHNPAYLVGFNFKFDLLHLLRYEEDFEEYMRWVADGGQVWDAQLAEYLLDGQDTASHYISLDETAPRYGGTVKIDEVKAMWAAGINTPDIPEQLLMDYLLGRGDDLGDIGNTRKVFLGQLTAARKTKQVRSIQLNNGALLATVEMERNGLFVDTELGFAKAKELAAEVAQLHERLHEYLPKDLPFEFKWTSRFHKSALIFGGTVTYKARAMVEDEDGNQAYVLKEEEHYLLEDGTTLGTQWYEHVLATEWQGEAPEGKQRIEYKAGKRAGQYKTKKVKVPDLDKPKSRIEDFQYTFPGFTKPRREWASSDPGFYSTKAEVIESLGGQGIPFLDDFATLQDKAKDLGTYYLVEETDDEGNVTKRKGMLALVHEDGLVHANISMTATVTARFAHNVPNVGNLPRSDTSDVKQMFVSRWGAKGYIVQSDFTSLEVFMQAFLSGDKQLIADLQAGLDMHIKRLTQVFGADYDQLVHEIKDLKTKLWVQRRKNIKTFSFQRAYGSGAPNIARSLKVPVTDVEAWIEADEAMYPGITRYQTQVKTAVMQSRIPTATFVTHPLAKVQVQLGIGKYATFDGKVYTFRENTTPEFLVKRGQLTGFSPTETKNYPVQGLGGEWMKAALWLLVRSLYKYKRFGGLALLVNTVHDAAYLDVHESVRRKAGVLMHGAMLAATDLMEHLFGKRIPVTVPSETTWGASMYVEDSFEDPENFHAAAAKVRAWMKTTYMQGN